MKKILKTLTIGTIGAIPLLAISSCSSGEEELIKINVTLRDDITDEKVKAAILKIEDPNLVASDKIEALSLVFNNITPETYKMFTINIKEGRIELRAINNFSFDGTSKQDFIITTNFSTNGLKILNIRLKSNPAELNEAFMQYTHFNKLHPSNKDEAGLSMLKKLFNGTDLETTLLDDLTFEFNINKETSNFDYTLSIKDQSQNLFLFSGNNSNITNSIKMEPKTLDINFRPGLSKENLDNAKIAYLSAGEDLNKIDEAITGLFVKPISKIGILGVMNFTSDETNATFTINNDFFVFENKTKTIELIIEKPIVLNISLNENPANLNETFMQYVHFNKLHPSNKDEAGLLMLKKLFNGDDLIEPQLQNISFEFKLNSETKNFEYKLSVNDLSNSVVFENGKKNITNSIKMIPQILNINFKKDLLKEDLNKAKANYISAAKDLNKIDEAIAGLFVEPINKIGILGAMNFIDIKSATFTINNDCFVFENKTKKIELIIIEKPIVLNISLNENPTNLNETFMQYVHFNKLHSSNKDEAGLLMLKKLFNGSDLTEPQLQNISFEFKLNSETKNFEYKLSVNDLSNSVVFENGKKTITNSIKMIPQILNINFKKNISTEGLANAKTNYISAGKDLNKIDEAIAGLFVDPITKIGILGAMEFIDAKNATFIISNDCFVFENKTKTIQLIASDKPASLNIKEKYNVNNSIYREVVQELTYFKRLYKQTDYDVNGLKLLKKIYEGSDLTINNLKWLNLSFVKLIDTNVKIRLETTDESILFNDNANFFEKNVTLEVLKIDLRSKDEIWEKDLIIVKKAYENAVANNNLNGIYNSIKNLFYRNYDYKNIGLIGTMEFVSGTEAHFNLDTNSFLSLKDGTMKVTFNVFPDMKTLDIRFKVNATSNDAIDYAIQFDYINKLDISESEKDLIHFENAKRLLTGNDFSVKAFKLMTKSIDLPSERRDQIRFYFSGSNGIILGDLGKFENISCSWIVEPRDIDIKFRDDITKEQFLIIKTRIEDTTNIANQIIGIKELLVDSFYLVDQLAVILKFDFLEELSNVVTISSKIFNAFKFIVAGEPLSDSIKFEVKIHIEVAISTNVTSDAWVELILYQKYTGHKYPSNLINILKKILIINNVPIYNYNDNDLLKYIEVNISFIREGVWLFQFKSANGGLFETLSHEVTIVPMKIDLKVQNLTSEKLEQIKLLWNSNHLEDKKNALSLFSKYYYIEYLFDFIDLKISDDNSEISAVNKNHILFNFLQSNGTYGSILTYSGITPSNPKSIQISFKDDITNNQVIWFVVKAMYQIKILDGAKNSYWYFRLYEENKNLFNNPNGYKFDENNIMILEPFIEKNKKGEIIVGLRPNTNFSSYYGSFDQTTRKIDKKISLDISFRSGLSNRDIEEVISAISDNTSHKIDILKRLLNGADLVDILMVLMNFNVDQVNNKISFTLEDTLFQFITSNGETTQTIEYEYKYETKKTLDFRFKDGLTNEALSNFYLKYRFLSRENNNDGAIFDLFKTVMTGADFAEQNMSLFDLSVGMNGHSNIIDINVRVKNVNKYQFYSKAYLKLSFNLLHATLDIRFKDNITSTDIANVKQLVKEAHGNDDKLFRAYQNLFEGNHFINPDLFYLFKDIDLRGDNIILELIESSGFVFSNGSYILLLNNIPIVPIELDIRIKEITNDEEVFNIMVKKYFAIFGSSYLTNKEMMLLMYNLFSEILTGDDFTFENMKYINVLPIRLLDGLLFTLTTQNQYGEPIENSKYTIKTQIKKLNLKQRKFKINIKEGVTQELINSFEEKLNSSFTYEEIFKSYQIIIEGEDYTLENFMLFPFNLESGKIVVTSILPFFVFETKTGEIVNKLESPIIGAIQVQSLSIHISEYSFEKNVNIIFRKVSMLNYQKGLSQLTEEEYTDQLFELYGLFMSGDDFTIENLKYINVEMEMLDINVLSVKISPIEPYFFKTTRIKIDTSKKDKKDIKINIKTNLSKQDLKNASLKINSENLTERLEGYKMLLEFTSDLALEDIYNFDAIFVEDFSEVKILSKHNLIRFNTDKGNFYSLTITTSRKSNQAIEHIGLVRKFFNRLNKN